MRIVVLLIISLFYIISSAVAQKQVNQTAELWTVWEEANTKLRSGKFDEARILFKAYQAQFGFRLDQVEQLENLYSQGDRLQKTGHYLEAIAIYKKHRSISGIGSLTFFEKKIDECVAKMGTPNIARLKTLERQVFAAELLFRAQRELDHQNSSGALKDFTQAKTVIGNIQGSIKIQIERSLAATNQFIKWEREYQLAKSENFSRERERDLLVELGYIPLVKIPSLNRRLATLIEEIEGKNVMQEAVRNCELERLVENLRSSPSVAGTEAAEKQNYFRSIYNKIEILKSDRRNDSTVFSAYRSLSSLVDVFPAEVRPGLKRCIEQGKLAALETFREQAKAEGDRSAAAVYNRAILKAANVNEALIVQCEGIDTFKLSLSRIKDFLGKCNAKEAQTLWTALQTGADCEEKRLLIKASAEESKRIAEMVAADRRYDVLLKAAKDDVQRGRYKDAKVKYTQLSKMPVCDVPKRDAEVKFGLIELRSLEGKHGIEMSIVAGVGANKPLYQINSERRLMDYGFTFSGGLQFAYVNPSSPADLILGAEYLSTSYYSTDNDSYAIEKFTVNGFNGSLAIKVSPFKKRSVRPYFKVGFEGMVPISRQYEKYGSLGAVGNDTELRGFLPSVVGAIGVEFKIAKTYLFLEAMGSASVQSVFERNSVNGSSPINSEVNARFRRATMRIGVKLF